MKKLIFLRILLSGFGLSSACFLLFSFPAGAVKIQFPDEELALESVLPVVEPLRMVLNRNISLKFRPEFGLGLGFGLDEPFYFSFYPSGLLAFHLTETHAVSLTGMYFLPRLSSAGRALSQGKGLEGTGKTFDPLKAPYPQMAVFLNYQYSPSYGKISLSKNWVLNLSMYGFTGMGLVITNQNNRLPAGNIGIGQKLYLNKWLGIRGDLGIYGYYGPATARLQLDDGVSELSYEELQSQEKRLIINVIANVGVIFLI